MPAPSLIMQTTYAELLERCSSAAFGESFAADGAFIQKTINGRNYWYFQLPASQGRAQKYVGPETPELIERITHHKEARDDERERRALVSTLVRSFGLPRPPPEIGNVIAALAEAGVFRLRAVLVGTIAYQSYSAMLGTKLPNPTLQTGDIDIAQFRTASIAVEDSTPPVLDILKNIDKTFRPVPHVNNKRQATSYQAKSKLRVDFLTPNDGADTDAPQPLPALRTDAEPLRFLDFLIHEPEPAVVLHDGGICVLVPAPQRYAVHKLIISRRRSEGTAKRDKDLRQAQVLLELLAQKRPYELKSAWREAYERGPTWRQLILEGMSLLATRTRDITLKAVDVRRDVIPGLDLTFSNPPPRYDSSRDVATFVGEALGSPVKCAISREALDDHFGAGHLGNRGRVEKFLENRSVIENLARTKYLSWPIEEADTVLIKTEDVSKSNSAKTAR
jgi:hypothetical protein